MAVLLSVHVLPGCSADSSSPPAHDALHQTLEEVTFVAFDLETTGLDAARERIVEIAAVKFRNRTFLEARSWLINPGTPVPEDSARVHGISDALLESAPAFPSVYPDFCGFIRGCVLVAHNAPFDVRFLLAETRRHRLERPGVRVLDSLALARRWYAGQESYRLPRLVESLGLPEGGFHRALADAHHVMHLFTHGSRRLADTARVEDLVATPGTSRRF